jgi:hypothetical protein
MFLQGVREAWTCFCIRVHKWYNPLTIIKKAKIILENTRLRV